MLHAQQKQSSNFTGGTVTPLEEKPEGRISHYRFAAGARTKWHSHEKGQLVLVEEGVGRTQAKGGPVIELRPGESAYGAPGVAHWHGAAPDQAAVMYNVARGGVVWMDEVTEKEYTAKPVRK